jgi:hypothetical protein
MLIDVSEFYPEKREIFKNVTVSRMAVQRRIADISDNLSDRFRQTVNYASTP